MKKSTFCILVMLVVIILSGLSAVAQKPVKVDKDGTYVSVADSSKVSESTLTGKTFKDAKGVKYPIWESVNGKFFYYKTAKTSGKTYKVYIKM